MTKVIYYIKEEKAKFSPLYTSLKAHSSECAFSYSKRAPKNLHSIC